MQKIHLKEKNYLPKYTKSNYPSNFNELIINKILKDEVNKDILNFILNDLLIKDWLEIFLYKKSFEDFNKYNEFNPNDFFVQKNKGIDYDEFLGNLFYSQDKEDNEYIEDDKKYQEQLYFFSNINKETNLTDINANKPKRKLFEIKKENVPKYFTENSINNIIKRFDIGKELKLKLLLDTNIKNNEIEQIKRVLESDTKKRRKRFNNDLYRIDHILKKLINTTNPSLLNFVNNLIGSLYSKERIYMILEGIIPSNEIEDSDLKNVIKKNDFIIRNKLLKI